MRVSWHTQTRVQALVRYQMTYCRLQKCWSRINDKKDRTLGGAANQVPAIPRALPEPERKVIML